MIDENIRRIRKERGISQENLAAELHVVRQTVSKWETGLSVPDAETVIRMAQVLEVPVETLLGIPEPLPKKDLAQKLAEANESLAQNAREARNRTLAGQKRGMILLLSMLTMAASLIFGEQWITLALVAGFTAGAVAVLYRNLSLLTLPEVSNGKSGLLRMVTLIDMGFFAAGVTWAVLVQLEVVPGQGDGRIPAMVLVSGMMIFSGVIGPRLPFNRHTGLRLPWTVTDRDAWNAAHRTLGITALPTAVIYCGAALTIEDFRAVTLGAVILWIGLPAGISYLCHRKNRDDMEKKENRLFS